MWRACKLRIAKEWKMSILKLPVEILCRDIIRGVPFAIPPTNRFALGGA